MTKTMNIVGIDNIKYIIEKQQDETLESFNMRVKYILIEKPESKKKLDLVVAESFVKYNEKHMKCKYN